MIQGIKGLTAEQKRKKLESVVGNFLGNKVVKVEEIPDEETSLVKEGVSRDLDKNESIDGYTEVDTITDEQAIRDKSLVETKIDNNVTESMGKDQGSIQAADDNDSAITTIMRM